MHKADIGLIGLAVMGQNLALNINDHGYAVSVYNRTLSTVDAFMDGPARDTDIIPAHSIEQLVDSLDRPRRVMLMVKAGEVVDHFIDQLRLHLEPGDIIIDGGNSLYTDTERRTRMLAEENILYIGTGISGGEEGARTGPSIMPGGNPEAWPQVKNLFQDIAAQVDGVPCCDWVGEGGAGHFVKMVHNGIEYGDMQLISEAYDLMTRGMGLDETTIAQIFGKWNKGKLSSYLIEITSYILKKADMDGSPLIGKILDTASQKGTGKWTGIAALELGVPLSLIAEAVFARFLSALKEQRVQAATLLTGPQPVQNADVKALTEELCDALYAAKIISYAQGYMLMREAAHEHGWNLQYGSIALMWRGGCIIRSIFLDNIQQAFADNPKLDNLLLDQFFLKAIDDAQKGWRRTVIRSVERGVPMPAIAAGLAFYDGYRSERLPANLLQAQRDYFGAHTYERVDRLRGNFFHTDWKP